MSDSNRHLFFLHELSDYKVADDDPDVRGWEVTDSANNVIGKVDNLLVSKEKKRVRYLDVEVDESIIAAGHEVFADDEVAGVHEFENRDGDTHLILPVGMAKLDKDNKIVHSNEIDKDRFSKVKRFKKNEPISKDYEVYTMRAFKGKKLLPAKTEVDESYYDRDEFQIKK